MAALHAKVKNQRRDALHKFSRSLVDRCSEIIIGDASPAAVGKTRLAKSVYDNGWTMLRSMLRYKCEHAGIRYAKVHERNTTRTCSCCGAIPASSPRGRTGLGMREWTCCECGARHDRDVNAAQNILELGRPLFPVSLLFRRAASVHRPGSSSVAVAFTAVRVRCPLVASLSLRMSTFWLAACFVLGQIAGLEHARSQCHDPQPAAGAGRRDSGKP